LTPSPTHDPWQNGRTGKAGTTSKRHRKRRRSEVELSV
jgi:hypothetical protein